MVAHEEQQERARLFGLTFVVSDAVPDDQILAVPAQIRPDAADPIQDLIDRSVVFQFAPQD